MPYLGQKCKKRPPEYWFWRKVSRGGPDDCWLWRGACNDDGYGLFWYDHTSWLAHRFSYILHYTNVADDLYVLHTCDNPACVNPTHLFLGTQHDNMLDMAKKKRHPRHKLSVQAVAEIRKRAAAGETQSALAKEFGVCQQSVCQIVHNKCYKYVRTHES